MADQSKQVFDAVVVGSGASGGWACKRLAEAGLKVALVDAGRQQSDKNFTEHVPKFKLKYRNMAHIDFAIVCSAAHQNKDWDGINEHPYPPATTKEKLVFERTGPVSDIGRPYEISDLKLPDTVRVYQFENE